MPYPHYLSVASTCAAGCHRFNRNYSHGSLLALNPHNLGGLLHFPLSKRWSNLPICRPLPLMMRRPSMGGVSGAGWRYNRYGVYHFSTGVGGGVVSGGKLRTGPGVWRGISGIRLPIRMVQSAAVTHRLRGSDCFWSRHCSGSAGELAGANAKTIFTRAGQGDERRSN